MGEGAARHSRWERGGSGASRRVLWAFLAGVGLVGAVLALRPHDESSPLAVDAGVDPGADEAAVVDALVASDEGSWRGMDLGPLRPRWLHLAVWTGECDGGARPPECGEVIVWGGVGADGWPLADGAAYDPARDAWRPIAGAPHVPLRYHPVPGVWTGPGPGSAGAGNSPGELVVWGVDAGAAGDAGHPWAGGMAYDPVQDAWRDLPAAPLVARVGHSLVWTGTEAIVWGGRRVGAEGGWHELGDGAAYDPRTGTWRLLPEASLEPRSDHVAVGLAGGMVVWGGAGSRPDQSQAATFTDGAVYDAERDRWWQLPSFPLDAVDARGPPPRASGAHVGEGLMVAPPFADEHGRHLLAWHPLEPDAPWQPIHAVPLRYRRDTELLAVGEDTVLLWGADRSAPNGVVLEPGSGLWRVLRPGPAPTGLGEAVVWTGPELVVWGGGDPARPARLGNRYRMGE